LITAAVFIASHSAFAAAMFFITMQVGSLSGAMWAMRLKNKLANQVVQPRQL
jgi:hypothetical protein